MSCPSRWKKARVFGPKLKAGLTTLFNLLALNLALLVASLPLLTAPAAVSAASATSGYLAQLAADQPGLRPVDLWSVSARLAVRNVLVAGPLSAIPVAGLTVLAGRDPAILLLGLPLFLLHALKLIARPGLHRLGLVRQ